MNPTNAIEDPAVGSALDVLAPAAAPDIDAGWRRQVRLRSSEFRLQQWRFRVLKSEFRVPAAAIAATLTITISLFTAPVQNVAAQLLTKFRVQDVQPISVSKLSQPLPDLRRLGDMSPDPRDLRLQATQVASVSAASAQAGFAVKTPSQLPAGLPSQPSVVAVTNGANVSFTFRTQRARSYLDSIGHSEVAVPAKFDGANLQLHVSSAVSLAYLPAGASPADLEKAVSSGNAGGKPDATAMNALLSGSSVVLIEAKSPELEVTGVSADELRSFLLSLPGIPEDTKAQLRAIGDWKNTLPVPAEPGSNMRKVSISGAPGVVGRNGPANMALWINGGIVYVATGPKIDESALLQLASSLK